MNRIRMRMYAAKDLVRLHKERGREALALSEIVIQNSKHYELPLPPSPLGLSNYDALDLEDDLGVDDQEEGDERCSSIYSDFNIMNPTSSDGDVYDYLDALDGISPEDLPDTPPQLLEDGIVDILREEERHGDSFFVSVG